jgi:hypothetical protein
MSGLLRGVGAPVHGPSLRTHWTTGLIGWVNGEGRLNMRGFRPSMTPAEGRPLGYDATGRLRFV